MDFKQTQISVALNKHEPWIITKPLDTVIRSAMTISDSLAKQALPCVGFAGKFEHGKRVGSEPVTASGLVFIDIDSDEPLGDDIVDEVRSLDHVIAAWPSYSGGIHALVATDFRPSNADEHKQLCHSVWDVIQEKLTDSMMLDRSVSSFNQVTFLPRIEERHAFIKDAEPFVYVPTEGEDWSDEYTSWKAYQGDAICRDATVENFAEVAGHGGEGWSEDSNVPCPLGHNKADHKQKELYFARYSKTKHLYARCVGDKDHSQKAYNFRAWCDLFNKDPRDYVKIVRNNTCRKPVLDLYNLPPLPDPIASADDTGVRIIPKGMYSVIYGGFSTGKSWIALEITRRALQAGIRVAYIDAESNTREMTKRLGNIGAYELAKDFDKFSFIREEQFLGTEDQRDQCIEEIIEWLDGGLVVFDTIGSLDGHTNDNKEASTYYRNYIRPFIDGGCAVLGIDHDIRSKSGQSDRGQHGAIGASAKSNSADVIYHIKSNCTWDKDLDGIAILTLRKDKEGITEGMAINANAFVVDVTWDAVEGMKMDFYSDHNLLKHDDDVCKLIMDTIGSDPMSGTDIAHKIRKRKDTVLAQLKILTKMGQVEMTGSGRGQTYRRS